MSEAEELIDQTQPIRKVRQIGDSPVRSETSVPHVSAPRESVPIGSSEPTPEATVGISPEVVAKVIVACPRCGAKMIDPEGLGLCSKCGYCRAVERQGYKTATSELSASAQQALSFREVGRILDEMPGWIPLALVGAMSIVFLSLIVGQRLPPTGDVRKWWATAQVSLGILLFYIGQWCAWLRLSNEAGLLGVEMLLVSPRVWKRTISDATTEGRWPIYFGCWGVVCLLCAALMIGGLNEWIDPVILPPANGIESIANLPS